MRTQQKAMLKQCTKKQDCDFKVKIDGIVTSRSQLECGKHRDCDFKVKIGTVTSRSKPGHGKKYEPPSQHEDSQNSTSDYIDHRPATGIK
jgi:hypothetical protein